MNDRSFLCLFKLTVPWRTTSVLVDNSIHELPGKKTQNDLICRILQNFLIGLEDYLPEVQHTSAEVKRFLRTDCPASENLHDPAVQKSRRS